MFPKQNHQFPKQNHEFPKYKRKFPLSFQNEIFKK